MKNNTIPYFVIYSGEYKVFRSKLTAEEILKVIDKVSDISVLGVSDIAFSNRFQELYFDKLMMQYGKNLKSYQAKINNGKKGGRPKKTKQEEPQNEVTGDLTPPSARPVYDITCNPLIDKCFDIYKENCKDLKPVRYERRNRDILEIVAQFIDETQGDFDYLKEVCVKANEQRTLCDNALDFKGVLKNHIAIYNEKFKKGNSGKVVSKLKFK